MPLGGPVTIRQMNFDVVSVFTQEEMDGRDFYSLALLDPSGQVVEQSTGCHSAGLRRKVRGVYRGNGVYTAVLTTYPYNGTTDRCQNGTEQRFVFTVNAFTALQPVEPTVVVRGRKTIHVPVDLNPGSRGSEIHYARDGVVGPDGGLLAPFTRTMSSSVTRSARVKVSSPGRYVMVARATPKPGGVAPAFSPWSAPAVLDVLARFGVKNVRVERRPRYKIRFSAIEPSASGTVQIAIAKRRDGRYKPFTSANMRDGEGVSKRYKPRGRGRYFLRFTFEGSTTTAPGTVVKAARL